MHARTAARSISAAALAGGLLGLSAPAANAMPAPEEDEAHISVGWLCQQAVRSVPSEESPPSTIEGLPGLRCGQAFGSAVPEEDPAEETDDTEVEEPEDSAEETDGPEEITEETTEDSADADVLTFSDDSEQTTDDDGGRSGASRGHGHGNGHGHGHGHGKGAAHGNAR